MGTARKPMSKIVKKAQVEKAQAEKPVQLISNQIVSSKVYIDQSVENLEVLSFMASENCTLCNFIAFVEGELKAWVDLQVMIESLQEKRILPPTKIKLGFNKLTSPLTVAQGDRITVTTVGCFNCNILWLSLTSRTKLCH